jgi:hypothetical protein
MTSVSQSQGSGWRIVFRSLMAACVTLSIAILWGEARRQGVQEIMHGIPLDAALVCGSLLLLMSFVCLRRFGRLAIYGLAVSVITLFVCFLPTV